MIPQIATGTLVADGSAVNISCGFTPTKITMINVTDATTLDWFAPMPEPSALKSVTAGTMTYVTTGYLSTWAGANPQTALTGTAATTAGSTTLTGTSSKYLYELAVGDAITVSGVPYKVVGIASATSITLDRPADATVSGITAIRVTGKGAGFNVGATAATSGKTFYWQAQ